jgi:hypothetical protein
MAVVNDNRSRLAENGVVAPLVSAITIPRTSPLVSLFLPKGSSVTRPRSKARCLRCNSGGLWSWGQREGGGR